MAFFTWQPGSRWPMRAGSSHAHTPPSYTFPTHFAVDRLDGRGARPSTLDLVPLDNPAAVSKA